MSDAHQPELVVPQMTSSNTKREMLAAYKDVVKRLNEKRETELKPLPRAEEKQRAEAQVDRFAFD